MSNSTAVHEDRTLASLVEGVGPQQTIHNDLARLSAPPGSSRGRRPLWLAPRVKATS
ncbi:hypothetical protein PCANC_05192 [Puccinia coronata f. sp. avenae]|uniref:Uncharacterized protein n=1 Tax=Puccinia coronata f. sp. avenae TaxID=200324 RepID=A0A2N5TH86_9BASI|nr:hypothetical protein PCASD_05248 [Puccinia coronata f. sp. avenae]PLW51419.1 hypothetical protein PCASD_00384 [Puccinia coronata f. sp. avenae]PLW54310.1 hypothetical protein PCANC_05192 [Puccinia coronata f. sp. avenae]